MPENHGGNTHEIGGCFAQNTGQNDADRAVRRGAVARGAPGTGTVRLRVNGRWLAAGGEKYTFVTLEGLAVVLAGRSTTGRGFPGLSPGMASRLGRGCLCRTDKFRGWQRGL
jgi:hypothetical protein